MTVSQIARLIDHAVLHPTQTDADLEHACALADQWQIATVCVKPYHVFRAAGLLSHSPVGIGTVIGFPHGNSTPEVKYAEAEKAMDDGASEVDMVVNIGKVLQGEWAYIDDEIGALSELCNQSSALLKVIFEADFITEAALKIQLCELCNQHEVSFVKTSTGFGFVAGPDGRYAYQGATEEDVKLMREHTLPSIGVKASGGIRTLDQVLRFHQLGATRIGTSSTLQILEDAVKMGDAGSL
jgi:deoxyribose-phosphate aldolase